MAAGKRDETRKKIPELILQYELHPEFRDVYVEGEADKRLLDWLFKKCGISDVIVYDIDAVEIPADVLKKHELPDGKKGRVVALAYELQGNIPDTKQVTCIADKDFDCVLGNSYSSPLLMMTDYSCQEMYFVTETIVDKFLTLVVQTSAISASQLLTGTMSAVQEMHLLRAANLSLKWGLSWVRVKKCIDVVGGKITFDSDQFVHKYLNSGSKLDSKKELLEEVARLRKRLTDDPRQHASKSDVFTVLAEVVPHYSEDTAFRNPNHIASTLAGCTEMQHMLSQPLYTALMEKLKS
jgi:hypothetical protein